MKNYTTYTTFKASDVSGLAFPETAAPLDGAKPVKEFTANGDVEQETKVVEFIGSMPLEARRIQLGWGETTWIHADDETGENFVTFILDVLELESDEENADVNKWELDTLEIERLDSNPGLLARISPMVKWFAYPEE